MERVVSRQLRRTLFLCLALSALAASQNYAVDSEATLTNVDNFGLSDIDLALDDVLQTPDGSENAPLGDAPGAMETEITLTETDQEADQNRASNSIETPDASSEQPGPFDPVNGVTITLPILGSVFFAPEKLPDGPMRAVFQAKAAEQAQQQYTMGILMLTQFTPSVSSMGNLRGTGTITLLGKTAEVKLLSYTEQETLFLIKPEAPLTFPLGLKTISFPTLTLSISPSGMVLLGEQSVFIQDQVDTQLSMGLSMESPQVSLSFIRVPLKEVIDLSNAPADIMGIAIDNAVAQIPNPLFPQTIALGISLTGNANLSQIVLYDSVHFGNADCSLTLGAQTSFQATGTQPIMFDTYPLYEPILSIGLTPGMPIDISFGGRMDFFLPGIGAFSQNFIGQRSAGDLTLQSDITGELKFRGFSLKGNKLVFSSMGVGADRSTNVVLSGTTQILDYEVLASLRLVKSLQVQGGLELEFKGQITNGLDIKPFENVPGAETLPGLRDLTITQPWVGITSDGSAFIGGVMKFNNLFLDAEVRKKVGGVCVKGSFRLPTDKNGFPVKKSWKLSDIVPGAPAFLDSIEFRNMSLMASSLTYYDHNTNMMVEAGLNLYAVIDTTTGIFADTRKILGPGVPEQITVAVVLNPNPSKCLVRGIIPLMAVLSDTVTLANISVEMAGSGSASLLVALKITPPHATAPLVFTSRVEFAPQGAKVAGTMQGVWRDPCGVQGFAVSDVAAEITLPFVVPPIPTNIGFAGKMFFGTTHLQVAVKVGAESLILLGAINELKLSDITAAARQAGVDITALNVIDLHFQDVKVQFAPAPGQIGELVFQQGTCIKGKMDLSIPHIIDTKAGVDIQIDPLSGVKASGFLTNCNIGPLKMTGKGLDGKEGTPDDGPAFTIALTPMEQRIYISGLIEFLGNTLFVDVNIKPNSVWFVTKAHLLGIFDADIEAESYVYNGIPGIRMFGETQIGDKKMNIVGNFGATGAYCAGQMKEFSLKDLAQVCNKMGAKIPDAVVPQIGLQDVEFFMKLQ